MLGYDLHGPSDAPALVLGSSLGATRDMWDEQLDALSARFRVVRYDHLGHGESPAPAGPYTIERLAAELVALLDHLGVERAHLAGVSLGGMVAMRLAATRPERVGRLALICTAARLAPELWRERAATVRAGGMDAITDTAPARWFTPGFAGTARAERLRETLRETVPEAYASCCDAIAAMDLRPLLSAIRAPVLVLAGAEDPATPPQLGRDIVDRVRAGGGAARFEVVPDAAHLCTVEQAECVQTLLLHHLDATAGEAPDMVSSSMERHGSGEETSGG